MDAAVGSEIDVLEAPTCELEHIIDELRATAQQRQDAAMVVAISMQIRAGRQVRTELLKPSEISSLADVDDSLKGRRLLGAQLASTPCLRRARRMRRRSRSERPPQTPWSM